MVTMIEVRGRITEAGRLEVDLPEGLPPGDVVVKIEVPAAEEMAWESQPWTEEEIRELLTFKGRTGAEIAASGLTGAWKDLGITDSQAWVEEVRRKQRERRGW